MTTVVVGGGLAGAFAARALDRRGEEVVVVDDGKEPGGVTVPIRHHGYLLEPAAGTVLLPHPQLTPLLEGLDLDIVPAGPVASRRFVRVGGRTVEVVPGPGLLRAPLVSWSAKLRMLAEPLVGRGADPDESLGDFLVRRLGRGGGRLVAGLMAAGVHAGDPERLSAAVAFPQLVATEQEHGSLLRGALARRGGGPRPATHVVVGGTAGIAGAVAASLGERWLRSWPVERIEQAATGWRLHGPETIEAGRVVAAVTPEVLAGLLGWEDQAWDWAPAAVVWLGLTAPDLPAGLGCLVGPDEGFASLGFLYESGYAPERAPAGRGLVKVLVGGARHPGVVDRSDDELVAVATGELALTLGADPVVEMTHVHRHLPGIPQYTPGRRDALARLRAQLPSGLTVLGWGYDGPGVSALASAAHRVFLPPV